MYDWIGALVSMSTGTFMPTCDWRDYVCRFWGCDPKLDDPCPFDSGDGI